jgi:eukaryotic-like serine/threonine-protein kinase
VLQPNQVFAGRYRIVRHVANSGTGALFEAEHVIAGARVALDLLAPGLVQRSSERRLFELEAMVALRLDSEHIVKVYDAGLDDVTGSPFLATELLVGETLAERVERSGPLPPADALALLRAVARGLDAAHRYHTNEGVAQPIVHGDLRPENLLLATRRNGTSLVKILDLGITKRFSARTEVSREKRGTPFYFAFEQAAGGALSPQTDIWAFGLITYFALTARCYWPAATAPTFDSQALFAEIVSLPLALPSRRLRQEGSPIVLPVAFDRWLLRCIDRKPICRFASAGEAVEALERALGGGNAVPTQAAFESERPRSLAAASVQLALGAKAAARWVAYQLEVASGGRSATPSAARRIALLSVAALALLLILLGAWLISRSLSAAEP